MGFYISGLCEGGSLFLSLSEYLEYPAFEGFEHLRFVHMELLKLDPLIIEGFLFLFISNNLLLHSNLRNVQSLT